MITENDLKDIQELIDNLSIRLERTKLLKLWSLNPIEISL
jgi:hypothetical protein